MSRLLKLMKRTEHCGFFVPGRFELDFLRLVAPMVPAFGNIEPNWGIEDGVLTDKQKSEVIAEGGRAVFAIEIVSGMARCRDGIDHSANKLLAAILALRGAENSVEILACNNVSGGLGSVTGYLDILLHDFPKFVANCELDRHVVEALGCVLAGSDPDLGI